MSKKSKKKNAVVSFDTGHMRKVSFDGRTLTLEDSFDTDDFCKAILDPEDRRRLAAALIASLPVTKEN